MLTRTDSRCAARPRHEAARLRGETEALRRLLAPGFHGPLGRQPVEHGVQVDRVELLRLVLEPTAGRQSLRVEVPAPVRVAPTRTAHAEDRPSHPSMMHRGPRRNATNQAQEVHSATIGINSENMAMLIASNVRRP